MDILQDRYMIVAKKLSSYFGFWPTLTYRERLLRSFIVGFMCWYSVLAQLCQLLTMEFNLRSIVLVLQVFIPVISTISIYYLSTLNFYTLKKILLWIVQDCQQLKDEDELRITQKHIKECKLFATVCGCLFYIFLCFSISPFILHIIITTNGKTEVEQSDRIFGCLNKFLKVESYYHPVVIYEILAAFSVATVATVIFSMYFMFIQHACARLCIIKYKIQELFENDQYKGKVLEKPLDLSDWTIDIIQRLSRTRKFMELVNKFSDKSYLFNMSLAFLCMVLDCLCFLQIPILIQNKETRKDSIAFLVFIVDTITPIYLNCFIGQRLMDYSSDVYKEMCLIPIHQISLKTQKLLLTTLLMNSKPCAISIGKMFISCHQFFGDLARMSFSFGMMLHSTQQI